MSTDKLTQRAKDILMALPQSKVVTADSVISAILDTSGMGAMLIKTFASLSIKKEAKLDISRLLKEAFYQAIKMESSYVGSEHLLLAMLKLVSSPYFDKVRFELLKMNIFPNALKNLEKSKKTPILDSFAENITQRLYKDNDKPLIYREEYNNLVSVLLQRNNANALLVGDAGVGKSSVIDYLARNINTFDVPPLLAGYQIIELDLVSFMTSLLNKGSSDLGLLSLIDELKSYNRVILSIKNFQNIFFATSVGFTVPIFYSMLKTTLESADIRVIATMGLGLYEKISNENEHLLDNFSIIDVIEPSEDQTIEIMNLSAEYLGKYHNVEISKELIKHVYSVAKDEIKDIKFPQKGLDLLDQACARLIMKKSRLPEKYKNLVDKTFDLAQKVDKSIEEGSFKDALKARSQLKKSEKVLMDVETNLIKPKTLKLTITDVNEALDDMGINVKEAMNVKNRDALTNLSSRIKKRIIGQDHAVDTVVKSLVRSKLGLRSKKRPMGNFLFLGPTGVGKTELAKVLSEEAFGTRGGSLIRLDMSDFAEKHNVARLVGAPPGYVGYGEGGELTQKIELHPDSVVLFDEIEKAHPDVLNILLQIMEEGELSDAKGNVFDFSRAVIILTSNLGTNLIQDIGIGFDESKIDESQVEERLKANLKKVIKPELLNRFDEVIVFRKLTVEDQLKVLNLLISDIDVTLKRQDVYVKVPLDARKLLLKKGFSDEYGARALRRVLEKELLDKIAEILLQTKARPLNIQAAASGETLILNTKLS